MTIMDEILDELSKRKTKRFAYKNLCVLSVVFFILYTGGDPLQDLQTSINSDGGLGFATLCAFNVGFAISSLFLPAVLLRTIGQKSSLSISIIVYLMFILANFYARWWTMTPAGFAVGTFSTVVWCAAQSYIKHLAVTYANISMASEEVLFQKFFGIFFSIFKLSQISGNVISSSVLERRENIFTSNVSCGELFCPSISTNLPGADVNHDSLMTLVGICLGWGIGAIIFLGIFLDRIEHEDDTPAKTETYSTLSTVKLMIDSQMVFMSPIMIFSGLQLGFLMGDFTESYVTCYIGVDKIGWVMMMFGLSSFVASLIFGLIGKWTGSFVILVITMIIHTSMLICFLNWDEWYRVKSHSIYVYLAFATLYGLCDSGWRTQIPVVLQRVFSEQSEEAFSLKQFWEGTCYAIAFAYGYYVCTTTKIYTCLGVLIAGMVGLTVVEIRFRISRNEYEQITTEGMQL